MKLACSQGPDRSLDGLETTPAHHRQLWPRDPHPSPADAQIVHRIADRCHVCTSLWIMASGAPLLRKSRVVDVLYFLGAASSHAIPMSIVDQDIPTNTASARDSSSKRARRFVGKLSDMGSATPAGEVRLWRTFAFMWQRLVQYVAHAFWRHTVLWCLSGVCFCRARRRRSGNKEN